MKNTDWIQLLCAFFHDPPDKALKIPGHVRRGLDYFCAASRQEMGYEEFKTAAGLEDQLASMAERLPMPSAGSNGERAVGPDKDGCLLAIHPLSGESRQLKSSRLEPGKVRAVLQGLTQGIDDPHKQFLTLWRLLPGALEQAFPDSLHWPADTRLPDHTIWNHLDMTAGLVAAKRMSPSGSGALLTFSLGPVQPFIAGARTVRDLWSGSAILSWLAFQGLIPILEAVGPAAVVFPALRGVPLMDLWLRGEMGLDRVPEPSLMKRKAPCLPNRFLALIPFGREGELAWDLARRCRESARNAWLDLAEAVRRKLGQAFTQRQSPFREGWSRRWRHQVDSFFEIRTAVLPWSQLDGKSLARLSGSQSFSEAFPDSGKIRDLAVRIPPGHRPFYPQQSAGEWQARVELVFRSLASHRSVRHVPVGQPETPAPPKCTLMGSWEQMGPAILRESREFWEGLGDPENPLRAQGVRLRKGERLCAIALTKRFAAPVYLNRILRLDRTAVRFDDTATVAAAGWLRKAGIHPEQFFDEGSGWSGQWLHWPTQRFDRDEKPVPHELWDQILHARSPKSLGPPPTYYALLMMDGDQMGQWLGGKKTPAVGKLLHPKLRRYFAELPGAADLLKARRPVSPALHAAISSALVGFSAEVVPRRVEECHGELIYSGGDDVLALLPTREALGLAQDLRRAFRGELDDGSPRGFCRGNGGGDFLAMGPTAGISAGIVIAHYKDHLAAVLADGRAAEKEAKESGRDCVSIRVRKRSGERSSAWCSWDLLPAMMRLLEAFEAGASPRWLYRFSRHLETLKALPDKAAAAELRRQIARADATTREILKACDFRTGHEAEARGAGAGHGARSEYGAGAGHGAGTGNGARAEYGAGGGQGARAESGSAHNGGKEPDKEAEPLRIEECRGIPALLRRHHLAFEKAHRDELPLENFLELCRATAFLARGRDDR